MKTIRAEDFCLKIFDDSKYYLFIESSKFTKFIFRINWKPYHYGRRRKFILLGENNKVYSEGSGIRKLILNLLHKFYSRYPRTWAGNYPIENFQIFEFDTEEEFNQYVNKLKMLKELLK